MPPRLDHLFPREWHRSVEGTGIIAIARGGWLRWLRLVVERLLPNCGKESGTGRVDDPKYWRRQATPKTDRLSGSPGVLGNVGEPDDRDPGLGHQVIVLDRAAAGP